MGRDPGFECQVFSKHGSTILHTHQDFRQSPQIYRHTILINHGSHSVPRGPQNRPHTDSSSSSISHLFEIISTAARPPFTTHNHDGLPTPNHHLPNNNHPPSPQPPLRPLQPSKHLHLHRHPPRSPPLRILRQLRLLPPLSSSSIYKLPSIIAIHVEATIPRHHPRTPAPRRLLRKTSRLKCDHRQPKPPAATPTPSRAAESALDPRTGGGGGAGHVDIFSGDVCG